MHSSMATAQEFIKNMPNFVGYSTYLPIYNLIRITIPSIKHPNISKYLDFALSSCLMVNLTTTYFCSVVTDNNPSKCCATNRECYMNSNGSGIKLK